MHTRLRQFIVLALTCGLLTALAPAAHAASGMEVALQDDGVFVSQAYFNRTKALAMAQKLHVTRIRVNLNWTVPLGSRQSRSRRAPSRPKYNWDLYDGVVTAAAQKGIAVQFALTGPAPAWATANHRPGPYGIKARYYRDFVKAAAQHFKGRVDRYSIWNEPNYVGWIAPLNKAPAIYRALYTVGYGTIKGIDPNAQVLFGETSPYALTRRATSPLAFLRGVFCADSAWRAHCGKGLKTDGYAHHPYDFAHTPTFRYPGADNVTLSGLSRLTSALDKLGRSGGLRSTDGSPINLYLTEDGYFASGKYKVSASTQAARLVQAFKIAQANPRVVEMLQYLLVQPKRAYAFFDTSIASRGGGARKAFTLLARWATGAARAKRIATQPVHPNQPSSGTQGGSAPSGGGGSTGGGGSGGGGGTTPPPSCGLPVCP